MAINTYTKNELNYFSCNPFHILGISCVSTRDEILSAYMKLQKLININAVDSYSRDVNIEQLELPQYSLEMLNSAYSDINNIDSKVFAFNSNIYTSPFSIIDITNMLDKIKCYDEMLSCYLWLLLNDNDFKYKDLWSKLCSYIDTLIDAPAIKWQDYFDNRFSIDDLNENPDCYSEFHEAFSRIILYPLKEIVENSESCKSAREILFIAISEKRTTTSYSVEPDDELIKLARQIEVQGVNDISGVISNSFEDEEEYEGVSLLDGIGASDNVYTKIVQENMSNSCMMDGLDIESASKEVKILKPKQVEYKIDEVEMSPVENLVSPKIASAKEMDGIAIGSEGVKQIAGENIDPSYKNIRRTYLENNGNFVQYQTMYEEQKKRRKSGNLYYWLLVLLILGGITAYFLYFFDVI